MDIPYCFSSELNSSEALAIDIPGHAEIFFPRTLNIFRTQSDSWLDLKNILYLVFSSLVNIKRFFLVREQNLATEISIKASAGRNNCVMVGWDGDMFQCSSVSWWQFYRSPTGSRLLVILGRGLLFSSLLQLMVTPRSSQQVRLTWPD